MYNTFAKRVDPGLFDQVLLWLLMEIIYDPTQVDLTSNFIVLCTNVKVY